MEVDFLLKVKMENEIAANAPPNLAPDIGFLFQNAQLHALWFEAVKIYREETGTALTDSDIRKLATLKSLTAYIETHHRSFLAFRSPTGKTREILTSVLQPLEKLGNVAAAGAAMVNILQPL